MTSATWQVNAADGNYNNAGNWTAADIPGAGDTGFFGTSTTTSISISTFETVGTWILNPYANDYNFSVLGTELEFFGGGIIVNGGSAKITNTGVIDFNNNSTAGASFITNQHILVFSDGSTAGNSKIANAGTVINLQLIFNDDSTAGTATIVNSRSVVFELNATGGTAAINNAAGGTVDFSSSAGRAGDHKVTVGSIAGAGTYELGADQLTVGLNARSTNVSGAVEDGGGGGGAGASLVKVGHGTLKLSHAHNTYSDGTTLRAGTLDLAAVGAAGTGAIKFAAGSQKLKIENTALSHHVFGNPIDFFGSGDVLDLTGLHFVAGATATYHPATHHLMVHSGAVTDTLALNSSATTHFGVMNDGHGGTDVLLFHA